MYDKQQDYFSSHIGQGVVDKIRTETEEENAEKSDKDIYTAVRTALYNHMKEHHDNHLISMKKSYRNVLVKIIRMRFCMVRFER